MRAVGAEVDAEDVRSKNSIELEALSELSFIATWLSSTVRRERHVSSGAVFRVASLA